MRLVLGCSTASHGTVSSSTPARARRLGSSITLTCQTLRCAPLPTRGDGSFDALYVGPRVRVSQNAEGGGVRTVHVRVTNFGGFR